MKTRQDSLYRCQSICKGSGYYSSSKEDRIIVISNLIEYVKENYENYIMNKYDESFLFSKEQLLSGNEDKEIKLYAVFDGHCGNFCSTYLQQMFPFELCAKESFKHGNYKIALIETYDNLHKKLLECKEYKPEEQTYIYCSGSTASVALVTEEETFFSFLGDSPIVIWKNNEDKPKLLFQEHNIENETLHQQLIDSNIFLVVSQPQNHKPLSKIVTEIEEKQKILEKFSSCNAPKKHRKNQKSNKSKKNDLKPENIRIGFSALNVWGTLGDSIYEPDIFNTFVKEIEDFRDLKRERLNQLAERLKSGSFTKAYSFMDIDEDEPEEFAIEKDVKVNNDKDLNFNSKNNLTIDINMNENKLIIKNINNNNNRNNNFKDTSTIDISSKKNNSSKNNKINNKKNKNNNRSSNYNDDDDNTDEKGLKQSSILQYFTRPSTSKLENINSTNCHQDLSLKKDNTIITDVNIKADPSFSTPSPPSPSSPQTPTTPTTPVITSHPEFNTSSSTNSIDFKFDFEKNPNISLKELHNYSNQSSYEEIIPFLMSRPSWSKLSKHISLSKKNLSNSKLFSTSINVLNKSHCINSCSLKRIPEITCINNSELKLFIIASDGVIRSYFEYKDQYNSMIMNNYRSPEKLLAAFKEFSSSINDDHSFISLFYNNTIHY